MEGYGRVQLKKNVPEIESIGLAITIQDTDPWRGRDKGGVHARWRDY